jgi:hypothetical protein
MKHLSTIAGILLGLLFLMASVPVLFHLLDESKFPKPVPGSADEMFMVALGTTGYMTFVKVLELLGGILVAVPKTRNFGLLILGPIIINILAYAVFIKHGEGLIHWMTISIVVLPLYLLWVGREKFIALKN